MVGCSVAIFHCYQEREERRGEMEFVPKARYEDCGEERDDDL